MFLWIKNTLQFFRNLCGHNYLPQVAFLVLFKYFRLSTNALKASLLTSRKNNSMFFFQITKFSTFPTKCFLPLEEFQVRHFTISPKFNVFVIFSVTFAFFLLSFFSNVRFDKSVCFRSEKKTKFVYIYCFWCFDFDYYQLHLYSYYNIRDDLYHFYQNQTYLLLIVAQANH